MNTLIISETEDGRIHCHSLVQEYCYHALNRRDRDRFHRWAAEHYDLHGNYLAAAHHHFARGDREESLNMLLTHAWDIINTGGAGALVEQLSGFDQRLLSPEEWVALCQTRGDAYELRGEYQQALAAYEAALEEATREEGRARLLRKRGTLPFAMYMFNQEMINCRRR